MSGSSSTQPGRLKRVFTNESGQLAVLIALIFQVLFILFAMVINVGLIIHDKINLQNSVDLAAYYGAERQAEAMNEIAHINYQIRQDYKLLVWRYRVLGTFGSAGHPAQGALNAPPLQEVEYAPAGDFAPSVCLGHVSWKQIDDPSSGENVCDKSPGSQMPALLPVATITVIPGITDLRNYLNNARLNIGKSCSKITPLNWSYAATMVGAFRLAVGQRKRMIQKIATDISQPDWSDAAGGSVRAGILNTLKKNLTAANADASSFSSSDVTVVNGLTLGGCGALTNDTPYWLQEIKIEPHIPIAELSGAPGICKYGITDFANQAVLGDDGVAQIDPTGTLKTFMSESQDIYHSSRGYEKNPWCLAYIGVSAKTHPRKPFAPLGQAIEMTARSFAEPFGGRIGPWDKNSWSQSADQSSGTAIDPLAVPRGEISSSGRTNVTKSNPYFPNYSRFPGDTLGLRSQAAIGLFRDGIRDLYQKGLLSLTDYADLLNVQTTADSLSYVTDPAPIPSQTRELELAAVAPDLFDAAYYSVDADYYHDYFVNRAWSVPNLVPMSDEGYRPGDKTLLTQSVSNQINRAQAHADVPVAGFYLLTKPEQLLTGWQQGRAVDYDPESATMQAKFGHCQQGVGVDGPYVPGNCAAGGRVGYSVRIVHKAYLNSAQHQLGGGDSGQGPLKNAPGETL